MRTVPDGRMARPFLAVAGAPAALNTAGPVKAADLSRPSVMARLVAVAAPHRGGFHPGTQSGALPETLSIHDAGCFAGGYAAA